MYSRKNICPQIISIAVAYNALLRTMTIQICLFFLVLPSASGQTWTPDNGNGTFSNPLFYDEFSDPDMIRVGEDYYLTGTTMHTMPGLPVLHSKDLVNWKLLGYAFDRLDLGPEFRLEAGKEVYGQGIWAPTFRYHNGNFYIFTNINRHNTQLFRARNPAGPWTRTELKHSFTISLSCSMMTARCTSSGATETSSSPNLIANSPTLFPAPNGPSSRRIPAWERARTSIRSRVNTTSSVHGGTAACACLVRVPTSRRAPMKA